MTRAFRLRLWHLRAWHVPRLAARVLPGVVGRVDGSATVHLTFDDERRFHGSTSSAAGRGAAV